jgi:hypothetical protein
MHAFACSSHVALRRLRQAEVEDFYFSFRRDLYMGGLQVAVDDALLMSGLRPFGNLAAYIQRFIHWKGPLGNPLRQRLAFHRFQNQEPLPLGLLRTVYGGDIGMIQ